MLEKKYIFSIIILYWIYYEYKKTNLNKAFKNKFKILNLENTDKIKLPQNFMFGVATSSYQTEGNNYNNWTLMEQQNNLEPCGIASNSWDVFPEDLKRMKYLGIKSYRFSIEWSRIQPSHNTINEKALNKYCLWCKMLHDNDIKPLVTLHHFTLPIWVHDLGGLEYSMFPDLFYDYASIVSSKLSKYVNMWVTFNEPVLETLHGYIRGNRPPNKKNDIGAFMNSLKNICLSHARVYHMLHRKNKNCKVSIAKNMSIFEAYNKLNVLERAIAYQFDKFYNFAILDSLVTGHLKLNFIPYFSGVTGIVNIDEHYSFMKNTLDYIGLNHYNVSYIDLSFSQDEYLNVTMTNPSRNYKVNDMDWDMVPHSLYQMLKSLKKYNLPICITENGCCMLDRNSTEKADYLVQCLYGVQLALEEDIQVIGYHYWSLVDNFEWDDGYIPRFGLFQVDYDIVRDQKKRKSKGDNSRKITLTGEIYRNIILGCC